MKALHRKINSTSENRKHKRQYRTFPHLKVAKMWEQGKTIATIADQSGAFTRTTPNILIALSATFCTGCTDGAGQIVKLPHRVSPATVRKSRLAGLRAA